MRTTCIQMDVIEVDDMKEAKEAIDTAIWQEVKVV